MKKVNVLNVLVILALVVLSLGFAACSASATTANCAFVVGDGKGGDDAKLHKIIYPGQTVSYDTGSEILSFVPCNSRNFIINDGTTKNANGQVVGDRATLITATTSTGVQVTIAASAYWTLNETDTAMREFYKLCFKYTCADTSDQGGSVNSSTPGWNSMLGENFGPAMDASARTALTTAVVAATGVKVDDNIWKLHDPAQYKALGDAMSADFADAIRAYIGYSDDLFCGSGNSFWSNPELPGTGKFTCSPVRVVVNDVEISKAQTDQSSQGAIAINAQRLQSAQALYGSDAGYWLGLQDTVTLCKSSNVICVINIGGGSGSVAVPVNNPAAVPTSSPTPKP